MIRLLQGTVHSIEDRSLILLVNGVGYQIFAPKKLLSELKEEPVTLHIHSHVREDAFHLYGFHDNKALNFFELLLSINGVGPKMALEILNEPAEQIQNAIFTGNIAALTKISGVGKKTAERIILELKGKVEPGGPMNTTANKTPDQEDAILALESLGYKRHHIQSVFAKIDSSVTDSEALIRLFLQQA